MKAIIWSNDAESVGEAAAAAKSVDADPVAFVGGTGGADAIAKALKEKVEAENADLVLVVANSRGSEVAPYLAALLDRPFLSRVHSLSNEGGTWTAERKYMGGRTVATLNVEGPVVVSINPRVWDPVDAGASDLEAGDSRVEVVEMKERDSGGVDIEAADVVVAFGRGVKNEDDMKMVFDLAEKLGGEVGCSRPIAQDLHWLGEDRWIGLSGKNVKPKLYVALGISGQIQHVAGCRDADTIVVVNTDKNCPFFKMADYGIVGDLYKVVPELLKSL